jgi:hypothetical protein
MHLLRHRFSRWMAPLLILLAAPVLSAAEAAQMIVIVADSRKFHGLRLWWANLYNNSHLHFALVTVLLVPLAGVILGSLADIVMSRLGINLSSRALREG